MCFLPPLTAQIVQKATRFTNSNLMTAIKKLDSDRWTGISRMATYAAVVILMCCCLIKHLPYLVDNIKV